MSKPKARLTPRPKVAAAGVSAQAAGILIYVAGQFGLDLPLPVALEVIAVVAFVAGYFKSE